MFFSNSLYNVIFMFYLLVCIILYIYHYRKEGFNNIVKDKIYYLFIDGNMQSYFRLHYMLLIENKTVQPLFINNLNDNNKASLKYLLKKIKKIENDYPQIKKDKKILEPIDISTIKYNDEFLLKFNQLLKINNAKYLLKNDNTILEIAKYSLFKDIKIDYTPIKMEKRMKKYLDKILTKTNQVRKDFNNEEIIAVNYKMNLTNNKQNFMVNINFPLFKKSNVYIDKLIRKYNFIL